jgi:hypothetical protein
VAIRLAGIVGAIGRTQKRPLRHCFLDEPYLQRLRIATAAV